ncbi:hypothetical protein E1B28_011004 [Marasmius oreades]|uniref:L-arabinokinase n=1 Tax=Marasmius oreades TaxID=181124 RepID=A0A9P7RUJ6_9AGAR|nr:uncharacterized protein E1B28_011004 [Marasmius oreades]KAG7089308.1 hypothetical protein E1B28_011004 [Marasmius oreades]
MAPPIFVYYCSGHGYGHATRVSALASHLLRLPTQIRPEVHIVSEASKHVFADSIALGAQYRYADWIDPVVVQPVAYRIDRQKSLDVLKAFISKKDVFVETERAWLVEIQARCVLSDAAFLGCLAAKAAGVPSILVTNFTFDSVYSYLSTTLIDAPMEPSSDGELLTELLLLPDVPIPCSSIEPLVWQIHFGYRHADLLLLLPGQIPIPSFSTSPSLPSPDWVDLATHAFYADIVGAIDPGQLVQATEDEHDDQHHGLGGSNDNGIPPLYPHIPFPQNTSLHTKSLSGAIKRRVLCAPLLVRSPTIPSCALDSMPQQTKLSVYTPEGRARLLSNIGVPEHQHDPEKTKILVVSFGGQVFRKPASGRSTPRRFQCDRPSPKIKALVSKIVGLIQMPDSTSQTNGSPTLISATSSGSLSFRLSSSSGSSPRSFTPFDHRDINPDPKLRSLNLISTSPLDASSSGQAMWIPGAPSPAMVPSSVFWNSPLIPSLCDDDNDVDQIRTQVVPAMPASPKAQQSVWDDNEEAEEDSLMPCLLPDESWIAIVCGVSKEQWETDREGGNGDGGLPENFYVAPKDVYMPDLTAAADVLLGKLGYGTVAECVDSKTPVVFVPRPLFIEEHGLKLLLQESGVPDVELTREEYEKGDWAAKVYEAWTKGKEGKRQKRVEEGSGASVDVLDGESSTKSGVLDVTVPGMIGIQRRQREGTELAMRIVQWVDECWSGC